MTALALQALVRRAIDYAGAFPPAQLPLDEAFRRFLAYRGDPDAWMLGRFVCPAARLMELHADCSAAAGPETTCDGVAFAVLGRGGQTTQEFFANVKADVADMQRFAAALPGRVRLETYEVRLPPSAFAPVKAHQLSSLIATAAYLLDCTLPGDVGPFFETPLGDRASALATIQALHDDALSKEAAARARCRPPGFKLRTGGLEAAAIPSVELVALVLAACQAARVPFKATAGLHHPLRHVDSGIQAAMHGFINLFVAACLAGEEALGAAELQAILADASAASFRFSDQGLHWQERFAATAGITAARDLCTSFGSCSFDEPRNDLRALGWL